MIRLATILALAVLLVLAALTAFGSTGGWLAGALLIAVAVTWRPSSYKQDGTVDDAKEQDDRKRSAATLGVILLGLATVLLAITLECGPPLLFIAGIVIAVLWLLRRSPLPGQIGILLLMQSQGDSQPRAYHHGSRDICIGHRLDRASRPFGRCVY